MTNINKGIINTGSIGGNASVTVTDYGSGNVIAPGSVVDIKQRAQKVEPGLIRPGGPASELADVASGAGKLATRWPLMRAVPRTRNQKRFQTADYTASCSTALSRIVASVALQHLPWPCSS